jgi:hypothetical protein
MIRGRWWTLLVAGLAAVALLLALTPPRQPATSGGRSFSLEAPSFVRVAEAAPMQQATFTSSAGMSAYFQVAGGFTLSSALEALYRTVETEPDQDYVIGAMAVPFADGFYDDNHDVHVYLHPADGWVVAYYPAGVPTSKIIDWRNWDTETANLPTKLEAVLNHIATTIGSPAPTVTYYHFAYPNANRLTLAADYQPAAAGDDPESDTFAITLPASLTYDERSWSLAHEITYEDGWDTTTYYLLNGTEVANVVTNDDQGQVGTWNDHDGTLDAGELPTGAAQTIKVQTSRAYKASGYAGLALVYQKP